MLKGIGRNLKYWVYTIEVTFLTLIASLLFVGLAQCMNDNSFWKVIAEYGAIFVFLTAIAFAFNGTCITLPFTVSMGSTRKDSFTAMQTAEHFLELQMVLIVAAAYIISGNTETFGSTGKMFMTYGMIAFWGVAAGNLISTIIVRFGRGVGIVFYIILMVAVAGGVAVMVATKAATPRQIFMTDAAFWMSLAADAVSIAVYYVSIRKIEVRV